MAKRVFVVDDHRLIRESYAEAIDDSPGLAVCGTAASFAEALEALPKARPDVAVVDIALGRDTPDGFELVRRLEAVMAEQAPGWLVVSAYDDAANVGRAQDAGAQGFLSKRDAGDALVAAVRAVASADARFRRYPASGHA